jgi:membrane protein
MFLGTSARIILRAFKQWGENKDTRLGAALAYYTLFSITPLLVFAITVASMVFDEQKARANVFHHLETNMDEASAEAIKTLLEKAPKPKGNLAPIIGLAMMMIGALGMFLHVRGSLCTIWRLEPPRGNTILGMVFDYVLALIMVFVTGILLLASLAASTVLPLVIEWVEQKVPDTDFHWRLVEMGISMFFLMLVFATIYRVLSGYRIPWRYVWYGSLIAALLFTLGKTLMGYYLLYFSPASVYGAAGSVMVFLLWVYYSSLILFFGAELIQARRTRKDWLAGKPQPANNGPAQPGALPPGGTSHGS